MQRIGQSLRKGGPAELQSKRFKEALHDTSSGLTYAALSGIITQINLTVLLNTLVGVCKQSVEDVERLFSKSMVEWMEKKGYNPEAKYLSIVRNWRRACDERGLSSDLRSQFNRNLLDYILDELIPWHKENSDLSLLEVNRYKNNLYDE